MAYPLRIDTGRITARLRTVASCPEPFSRLCFGRFSPKGFAVRAVSGIFAAGKQKKMKQTIDFLRRLACNNRREWFRENKSEYLEIQTRFNAFVEQLVTGISVFDPSVRHLTAKDCTYRIYRDTRFSNDKSPYKTHLGAFIVPGGKKSGFSGYYFQVSLGDEGYRGCHMLAAGDYCCDAQVLRTVREDIVNGEGDFDTLVREAALRGFELDRDHSLKRNPKGFPSDARWSDYLRLKNYCLVRTVDDAFLLAPDLAARTADLFRVTQPFVHYVNRAIEYVREVSED